MPFCSGIPGQRIGSKLSTPLQRGALTLWVSGGTGRGGTIPPRPHSSSQALLLAPDPIPPAVFPLDKLCHFCYVL